MIPPTPSQAAACSRPIDGVLKPDLFKALSDPTRLLLVACIGKCRRECSVGEVAECCSVDFSVVSRHLSLLARAGVLGARKEGRTVYYNLRHAELSQTLRALADAIEECCPKKGGGEDGRCC